MKSDTEEVGLDHNPILADTATKVAMTPIEAIPGHLIGKMGEITGVVHTNHTQTLIHTILAVTLHIKDILHTGVHQPTQRDCSRSCS